MITAYHRPSTIEEALTLISHPGIVPLGGGVVLAQHSEIDFEVADLQSLNLNRIQKKDERLEVGATATLQNLIEHAHTPETLQTVLKLEAPINLRTMATIAGALVTCDGRSPLATVLLAMDAKITLQHRTSSVEKDSTSTEQIRLGDLLPLRNQMLSGKLIIKIEIPLDVKIHYEYVARTPADKPIICVALVSWQSGRNRMVVGGWGPSPTLAYDGPGNKGIEIAASNAAHDAVDEWASSEYRSDIASILASRCLQD